MKNIIYLSLLFAFSFNTQAAPTLNPSPKIVGGEIVDATVTETRYIVSIGRGCGGSIIAPKWILTAAHCRSLFNTTVTAGGENLNDPKRIRLSIKKSYVHPDFKMSTMSHDFALLELASPIDFEATGLRSIAMVDPDLAKKGAIDPDVMATVLGWGTTSENGNISTQLRKVDVPIVSLKKANGMFSYFGKLDSSMLPAGYPEGKKDACQGDSGGPLVVEGTDGKPVLAGVVSWGKGCARSRYYGIYANVSVGYSWIVETMSK